MVTLRQHPANWTHVRLHLLCPRSVPKMVPMDATPADPPRLNEDETTPEEQAMDAAMGTVLKLLRIEKKLTLDQLAAEVGMNRKTIMRIESGERSIRMAQLYRLCIALGVMPSDVTEAAEKKVGIE